MRVSKRRSHDTRRGRRTLQKAREHATPAKRTMKTTVKKMLTRMPTCKKERSASLPSFLLAMLLTNTTTTRESQSVEGTDGREPFDLEQWVERSANFCNVVWQVKPRYSRFFLFFFLVVYALSRCHPLLPSPYLFACLHLQFSCSLLTYADKSARGSLKPYRHVSFLTITSALPHPRRPHLRRILHEHDATRLAWCDDKLRGGARSPPIKPKRGNSEKNNNTEEGKGERKERATTTTNVWKRLRQNNAPYRSTTKQTHTLSYIYTHVHT
jgi:hypothetical protein